MGGHGRKGERGGARLFARRGFRGSWVAQSLSLCLDSVLDVRVLVWSPALGSLKIFTKE